MEDYWELHIFKLNNNATYLVSIYEGGIENAWKKLANKLSRSIERTKTECEHLLRLEGGMDEVIKLKNGKIE